MTRTRSWRARAVTVFSVAAIPLSLVTSPAQATSAYAPPFPGSPGIGDPLFPALGNGGYDVQHYTVDFGYAPTSKTFTAQVVITARATQALSRFDLDLEGNTVGGVAVNGAAADWIRRDQELIITPEHWLRFGQRFRVEVNYSGSVAAGHQPSGFFVTDSGGFVTANQPDVAHSVFPCNDHQSDKATYTFHLTAPAGWIAVANGTLDGRRTHGRLTTWTFTEQHPIASELVSMTVDKYAELDQVGPHGLPIRSIVPTDQVAQYQAIVERTAQHLAWMEAQVGRYPFENYGVHIAKTQLGFALENQTLSLFDPVFFTFPQSEWDPVMVHELSHQWFGDSVAPAVWSDVWLNEGHATWYEWTYAESKGYYSLQSRVRTAYSNGDLDRQEYGPVAQPTVASLFAPNVYDGGALVLFALREKVGVVAFQRIERAWVRSYRDGVAGTQDFIALASWVSGQDLEQFLTDWLYGTKTPPMPGHPDWTVKPVTTGAATVMAAATHTAVPRP